TPALWILAPCRVRLSNRRWNACAQSLRQRSSERKKAASDAPLQRLFIFHFLSFIFHLSFSICHLSFSAGLIGNDNCEMENDKWKLCFRLSVGRRRRRSLGWCS